MRIASIIGILILFIAFAPGCNKQPAADTTPDVESEVSNELDEDLGMPDEDVGFSDESDEGEEEDPSEEEGDHDPEFPDDESE